MSYQIIKKKNNKYALWSTVIDSLVLDEASESQITDFFVDRAMELALADTTKIIAQLRAGENPYRQFAMTYEEAVERMKEVHFND